MTSADLNIIEIDHPKSVNDRCRIMLNDWLQKDTEATWEKLLNCIDESSSAPITISGQNSSIFYLLHIWGVKKYNAKKKRLSKSLILTKAKKLVNVT